MKLRLYHHRDGARVAYREAGTGPPLALLHSAGLSHREFEPLASELGDRFRLVLPDLPLHGDSEDRPRHPYTPDWLADVMGGFLRETCGPRPMAGGHAEGALLLVHAIARGALQPQRLVLMSSALHRPGVPHRAARALARAGALPGLDRLATHAARLVFHPARADRLTVRPHPGARDLARHAIVDLPGDATRARAWAKAAARWPAVWPDLLDVYERVKCPTLLLWADADERHPQAIADDALDLLPDAQLRVLSQTGFLMAYDDPVGVARELAAFWR
jgi:pimeloyl-ACP methyl ester carboxylesterase